MPTTYVLRSPISTGNQSLPVAVRDPLLSGVANSGVRFIADLAFPYSYPGGPYDGRAAAGAPATGDAVVDISANGNGKAIVAPGESVNYAGAGFDYSALTKKGSYVEIPASVASDIYTPYGGGASQQFLACLYVRLPTLADWPSNSGVAPLLHWSALGYNTPSVDLLTLGINTGPVITARRQTNGGATVVQTDASLLAGDQGALAQVAFWRNATGVSVRVKTLAGTRTTAAAVGADNSGNFSALTGKAGVGTAFWDTPLSADQLKTSNFRMYRLFVENLARSGRDPAVVLDADWLRVQARIAASAAANGGTSLIFV